MSQGGGVVREQRRRIQFHDGSIMVEEGMYEIDSVKLGLLVVRIGEHMAHMSAPLMCVRRQGDE